MNRLYDIFLQRNSSFNGKISVIGHSLGKFKTNLFIRINIYIFFLCLGSVILYDILVNQTPANEEEALMNEEGRYNKINIYYLICFYYEIKISFRKSVNKNNIFQNKF